MKRLVQVLIVLALALGLVVPAAQARPFIDTAVIVFQGTATVCGQSVPGKPAATACPAAKPQGLYGPGQGPGPNLPGGLRAPGLSNKWLQRTGNYSFSATVCEALAVNGGTPQVLPVKTCTIAVSGKLAPVAGIGAACGMTHGYAGTGPVLVGPTTYAVSNVGWVAAPGAILPITGTYTFTSTTDPAKDKAPLNGKRIGPIAALVVASGGAACLKSDVTGKAGASTFDVAGVAVLL